MDTEEEEDPGEVEDAEVATRDEASTKAAITNPVKEGLMQNRRDNSTK